MSNNKKRILIINSGGTISSIKTKHGYQPKSGEVADTLTKLPELAHADMPEYELLEYNPLLDSSNIAIQHWNQMALDIKKHYHQFDGFVILHGTDTLAYTASALSFMLENLAKPVIVTGAQIPLSALRSDGKDNLITAIFLAQSEKLNEVCVYFDQALLRGNRAQKVSAYEFSAFGSPNFPALAKVGIDVTWQHHLLEPKPAKPFKVQMLHPHYIANFRLFPSFSTEVLNHLLKQPIKGLVLETYGSGNAQDTDSKFITILENAIKLGIFVLNCSQCHQGMVNMDTYATGNRLKRIGVISGYNMTAEAAHCKLNYLLSKYNSHQSIKRNLTISLRGELDK